MQKSLALLLLAVSLSGCIAAHSVYYGDPGAGGRDVQLLDRATVKRPYRVVGMVEAYTYWAFEPEAVANELKAKASKMGGNAIVDLHSDRSGIFPTFVLIPASNQHWTAVVIRYE